MRATGSCFFFFLNNDNLLTLFLLVLYALVSENLKMGLILQTLSVSTREPIFSIVPEPSRPGMYGRVGN
jgi:hypothetical protein